MTNTLDAYTVFLALIATPDLPSIGPEVRVSRLPADEVRQRVDALCREHQIAREMAELLQSAALLWHDHLDASHALSQQIPSKHGSFLHEMMHRREPDYGNAKYWVRRVGDHPCYPEIARKVGELLDEKGASTLKAKLVPEGRWDPDAFVDACETAAEGTEGGQSILQEVQRCEFQVLIEYLFKRHAPSVRPLSLEGEGARQGG